MANIDIIRNRWENAVKVTGKETEIITASGKTLKGRYALCECGSFTPSHDAFNGFCSSVGFPTDGNGQNINDRDYQRDTDAQRVTRQMASQYDGRAIQSPVIVSPDGVVLSGNGRTMAGILAANDNTDATYIEYLKKHLQEFGVNECSLQDFQHPRIIIELQDNLPYTSATFAAFNAQDMKTMSKTEEAVKLGKIVDNTTFNRIVSVISGYDTLSEFYGDNRTALQVVKELEQAGVINQMQISSMQDGGGLGAVGREFFENILIGKAFITMPDAVRMITGVKILRRNVICALCEAVLSVSLASGYDLGGELSKAVSLVYEARKAGYKDGENVSIYARQITMFGDNATVSDYKDNTIMLLADAMNDRKESHLRKVLAVYNKEAKESAAGQMSMFGEAVRSKGDIMGDVISLFATGSREEKKTALADAATSKKEDAINIVKAPLKVGNFANVDLGRGVCAVGLITKKMPGGFLMDFGGVSPVYFAKSRISGSVEKKIILPEWMSEGNAIMHGKLVQVIDSIEDGIINLRWVNGGYFDIDVNTAVLSWQAA